MSSNHTIFANRTRTHPVFQLPLDVMLLHFIAEFPLTMPPSSTQWTENDMPRLEGRVALVTGANTGLGFATALGLARGGAHVVLACRSESRGRDAQQEIEKLLEDEPSTPRGSAEFMLLDVGSLESIRAFAKSFQAKVDRLDILVLNAGVKAVAFDTTVDGFEQQMGVNHLGHFALAALLFPLLKRTDSARVVSISSVSHRGATLDVTSLNAAPPQYEAMMAYRVSKLANLLFAYELQRRLKAQGITNVVSVACHPGVTESNLLLNLMGTYSNPIARAVLRFVHWLPWAQTNAMGALNVLCAATDPSVQAGEYIGPHGLLEFYGYPRSTTSSEESYSEKDAAELWTASEKLTGVAFQVK